MIPVSSPLFQGNEKKYLQQCIDNGWVSSDGYFVQKFEEKFAKWSGNKYAIAVCNGTAALETAIWAMKLKFIVIPSSTIISCVLAAIRVGCVFDFDDYSFEPKKVTYNRMYCHLFGKLDNIISNSYTMDDLSQYWKPYKVEFVGAYSLYANKLITSGEGGIIVTNKKEIYEQAKSYRNLCHSKERFVHNDLGYNFRMSNLQGAVALAQLEQIDKFTEIKQKNRDLYKEYLPDTVKILFDVEVPWMYLIETKFDAGIIVKKLFLKGIDCRRFFYPLHRQPCLKRIDDRKYKQKDFPNSDYIWEHRFYLPSGLTLTQKQIGYICKTLGEIL